MAAPVTVDLYRRDGTKDGTVELAAELFAAPVNVPVMHQVVTAQLAAARAGTSKTKSRGQVRGGGRKPWRQKGTGRARQGSIRAPHWAGGGVAHGPTGKENYVQRVPKKLKRLALRSALSDRAGTGGIRVVEDFAFSAPRTRDALALLGALDAAGRRALVVLAGRDEVAAKSFRNLPDVVVLTVDQLNTYDVLVADVVVFEQGSLPYVGSGTRADLQAAEPSSGGGGGTSGGPPGDEAAEVSA